VRLEAVVAGVVDPGGGERLGDGDAELDEAGDVREEDPDPRPVRASNWP
jgi:hypothetical protein